MKNEKHGSPGLRDLRKRAETMLPPASGEIPNLSAEELRHVLQELRTHQIELEMQNEELRRAQIEIEEARDRFSNLYDFAPVGYVTANTKGLVVMANLAFAEMLDVDRSHLIKRPLSAFILDADQDLFYKLRRDLLATRRRQSCELRMRRKDGATFWVEIDSMVVIRGEGEGLRFRCAIIDVTARKRAEEERRELEAKLQQTQKLESLGVLAGGIAHDFNNLLTTILGNAELALERLAPSSPAYLCVAQIDIAALRAGELVKQILSYAGKGIMSGAPLDLSTLVGEMIHLLDGSIPKTVAWGHHLGSDLPVVEADATQIRQVVVNLITNAADALDDQGGAISVATRVMDCNPEFFRHTYAHDDLAPGRYVGLEVTDTGCGMDKATQAKIFEPFFTTKAIGRGLGLAAVLGIVRAHRGAVRVASEPGRGTTVTVVLPAAERLADSLPSAQPAPELGRPTGTVLVVDDEPGVRAVAEQMLRRMGFEVLTAADGREGIEVFRRHADEIVLVLLDSRMPNLGGEEALPEIRRIRADAKVILCSGYSEQAVEKLTGKGPTGFLQKPYRLVRLQRLIAEVLLS